MLKRVLSFLLCIILLSFSIIIYTPVSVKADVSIYDRYNKVYDGYDFSDLISKHKSFNFTDKGGTKHAIKFVGGRWMYFFSSGGFIDDDTKLNYFLSWYAYTGYNTAKKVGTGLSAMISSKLGSLLTSSTDLLDSALTATTDVEFEYDDDNGLTILSDSVDKLREQLKKQYYESIGIIIIKPWGTVDKFYNSKSFRNMFDIESDYTDAYSRIHDSKVIFRYGDYGNTCARALCFNDYLDYDYLYADIGTDIYYRWDNAGHILHPIVSVSNGVNTSFQFNTNNCIDIIKYDWEDYNPIPLSDLQLLHFDNWDSFQIEAFSDIRLYLEKPFALYSDKDIQLFKSFEAYYNFLHGSQNAYLSSKINGVGEDIKISIDDMNTNISDKMDELIDSVNNKKDGMSADELQKAIDKGLASLSGKIDDIGDNTEQTNNKLDDLISIMREQNIILSDILGVTNKIANSVADDKDEKTYTISDIIPHFNKCFTAVKNMVLFGTSSFDDTGTQSVMSVDNDVGIAVYADDVEDNVKDYHNGILGKFPFSVPYQLYEWLQVLQCEPKTPEFKYNYGYLVGKKDSEETIIQFDLSNYNDWANVSRSFLKLSFTLALAVGVYRKFKGEI